MSNQPLDPPPSGPSSSSSSEPPQAPVSIPSRAHLPTKLGQPSTSSPRTLESNRRRLGSLFSSLSLSNPVPALASDSTSTDTPTKPARAASGTGPSQGLPGGHSSGAGTGGLWSWLSPSPLGPTNQAGEDDGGEDEHNMGDKMKTRSSDEGTKKTTLEDNTVTSDPMSATSTSSITSVDLGEQTRSRTHLLSLPDEVLVYIMSQLPPSPSELLNLSLVCRRLYQLSQAPVLWYHLFDSTPGFKLTDDALQSGVAVLDPPGNGQGHWEGDEWVSEPRPPPPTSITASMSTPLRVISNKLSLTTPRRRVPQGSAHTPASRLMEASKFLTPTRASPGGQETRDGVDRPVAEDEILVHYPTLYRSRLALRRQLYDPLTPPPSGANKISLQKHENAVYCIHYARPYLFTGSRDRSIQLWKIPEPGSNPTVSPAEPGQSSKKSKREGTKPRLLASISAAHEGSVLSMAFEPDRVGESADSDNEPDEKSGTLVTGSSDRTAIVWKVVFSIPEGGAGDEASAGKATLEKKATLRGCNDGVLSVAFIGSKIATSSKDGLIRLYDKTTFTPITTLTGHQGAVNDIAASPDGSVEQIVSVSSDGTFVIWDLATNQQVKRGGGDGRGLACVVWQADYILTGSNDFQVNLYSASTTSLIRTFTGHSQLVRAVSLDLSDRLVLSGGYDATVKMWDLDTGEMIRSRNVGPRGEELVFAVCIQGGRMIYATRTGLAQVLTYGGDLPYRDLFA